MCKKFLVFVLMFGLMSTAMGQVAGVDDPSDMADSSGDIKRVEAWVDGDNLNLTMTVYGVFAPSVEDTPADMSNRYYYHWILDTDNDPATGFFNDEYEGNPTNLETPIGVDVLVQFGWRDGATNGVYAYTLDPLTGDEVELFEDYEYTIEGDTIQAVIPLGDLGLEPGQTIAVSAYQEGASNDWQVDWVESFELTLTAAAKTVLFAEDFEGLTLGPNVDEELAGDAVWTDTPPEGWVVDDSGIPGIDMDVTDGVTEWAGWAFVDKAWWIEAAGDQDRSLFELGIGIVAVADPDEWDDAERLPIPIDADPYDTWLTTPEIKISSAEAGTLELKFDSSWRPEFDDNYHQSASITASFDGAEPVTVLLWESDEASENYHPYATNETVIVQLDNPEGAKKLVLTFGLFDAGNDWWWAIDNIEVRGVVPYQEPFDPGTDGLLAWYPLAGDANDISGNGYDGTITNADTGGLGEGGSVWVEDPVHGIVMSFNGDDSTGAVVGTDIMIPALTFDNDFTWAFWCYQHPDQETNNDTILGNRYGGTQSPLQFCKFTPTRFEFYNDDGNYEQGINYDSIPGGVWIHHVVSKNGANLTYYRNGVEFLTNTITKTMDENPFGFGGDAINNNEKWEGYLSDVRLYERALSEAEARYLAGERAPFIYNGDNLDDWDHDNSSDAWDGTGPGEGAPGGAALLDEDGVTFLRIQDTGDPRDLGLSDPSNRKIYLIHQIDLGLDGTRLEFQLRVATTPPLDDQSSGEPWPEGGIGYHIRDGGKGMVGIAEEGVGQISFSLAKAGEIEGLETDALVVNGLLGTEMSGDVDTGEAATPNYIAIDDATAWNNVTVDIAAGGAGTHVLTISINGGKAVSVDVTAGNGLDGENKYVAVGSSGTGGITAFDVDYILVTKQPPAGVDSSLSIYYTFDEVSDIVADQSGKGHDGIVVGDVTAEAIGMYGGAANLANTGYLDLDGANFPAEDIPTSDFTLAAWTNIDGTSNQNALFNARASDSTWLIHPEIRPGNGDYRFTIRGAGGVKIGDIDGGKTGYKQPEGTPVPNEWVHVAMTYSKADATMTLYVDGQIILRRGGDGAGDPIENAIDIAGDWGLGARVGYNIDDARHYTGLMDEFRMYTRSLSQDEIIDVMEGM